jgi:hypothetical protein
MNSYSEIDKEIIVVKYNEAVKHLDVCHNILLGLATLYNIKINTKMSSEPKEFFDKLNDLHQEVLTNFDEAKEAYLEAKEAYDKIRNK